MVASSITKGRAPDPAEGVTPLVLGNQHFDRLTHYLFRFPAKFHPPVVQALLAQHTSPGQHVLDPFCGSGTLLVEAARMERHSIGLDVDPIAVAVAAAKVHRYPSSELLASASVVLKSANANARSHSDYERLTFEDISESEFDRKARTLADFIPAIPNLRHWFRLYVVIDLANLRRAITTALIPLDHRNLFMVVFASIIRNCSNADPVPVSGLEVTAHMKRRDKEGRLINPFFLFSKAMARTLTAVDQYFHATTSSISAQVLIADAVHLENYNLCSVDAVITSPPYHGAVDYYRRHQLEMFWLGLTANQGDRLMLLDKYIGRPSVPQRDPLLKADQLRTKLAIEWDQRIREVSPPRANAFRHYMLAMTRVFEGLSFLLRSRSPALFVVGHSCWNSAEIPTTDLFEELSGESFNLENVFSYPVKNRYMSYSRHNGADIAVEHVLLLRRSTAQKPPLIHDFHPPHEILS
jgi:SAM-dependent methyltransferase